MKKAFLILGYILLLGSFTSFPPNIDYGQRVIKDSILINTQKATQLEAKIERHIDSVKSNVSFISEHSKANKSSTNHKRVRVIYKEKVKRVPHYIHETTTVYIPVNKSWYYIEQKHYTDSLAKRQAYLDSIQAARAYELKHRSIFRKIFGGHKK